MALSDELIQEFTSVMDDRPEKTLETTCYGKAVFEGDTGYVILDGAETRTPASFTVPAHENDRVLILLKNRKALVIGNITHPVIMTGTLYASDGVIVEGYLTTDELRTTYDDHVHEGLTYSAGGIGAYGSNGYWYVTNDGNMYVEQATVKGNIYASGGEIGGFTIDASSIHTKNKDVTVNDSTSLALSSAGFSRTVAGSARSNLMFAIGSGFGVDKDGKLYSNNAYIRGDIVATSLDLTGGYQIPASTGISGLAPVATSGRYGDLTDTPNLTIYIAKDGTIGNVSDGSDGVNISSAGVLTASNAVIYGTLYSSAGTIGGFTLSANKLYTHGTNLGANNSVYLGSSDLGSATIAGGSLSSWRLAIGSGFGVTNAGVLYATGAQISGAITATSLTLNSGVQIPASTGVSGLATVATSGDYDHLSNKPNLTIYIAKDGTIGNVSDGSDGINISSAGVLTASNAVIYGTLYSSAGTIGGFTLSTNKLYTYGTNLGVNNSVYLGSSDLGTATIAGKSLSTWRLAVGSGFGVTNAGVLYATGAQISGAITATSLTLNSGVQIPASTGVSGLATVATSGNYDHLTNKIDKTAIITIANDGSISIQKNNGTAKAGTVTKTYGTTTSGLSISQTGLLEASNAVIYGSIYAASGTIAGWTIASNKITKNTLGANESVHIGTADLGNATIADNTISTWRLAVGSGFGVDKNGVLYAKGARVSGVLSAGANSTIGPWTVTTTSIYKGNSAHANASGMYFGNDGLSITNKFYVTSGGVLHCNGAWMYINNTNNSNTGPATSGLELQLAGVDKADISFAQSATFGPYLHVGSNGKIIIDAADTIAITSSIQGNTSQVVLNASGVSITGDLEVDDVYGSTFYGNVNGDCSGSSGSCTGYTRNSEGNSYYPIVTSSTDKERIATIRCSTATTGRVIVRGQFNSTSYSTRYFDTTPTSSDIRLKTAIKDSVVEALPIVNSIHIREFTWKEDGKYQRIGVVADELEQLDSNLAIGGGYEKDGSLNIKSVNSFYLMGYLIKAIQELSTELDRLKGAKT